MEGRDTANLKDPMVKKTIELVGLWWAEAGRYNVLPLDDRFQERSLARAVARVEADEVHLLSRARCASPSTSRRTR